MQVPHQYESSVQSTNLPYTEQQQQPQQHLLQYETHMPSSKYGKVRLNHIKQINSENVLTISEKCFPIFAI